MNTHLCRGVASLVTLHMPGFGNLRSVRDMVIVNATDFNQEQSLERNKIKMSSLTWMAAKRRRAGVRATPRVHKKKRASIEEIAAQRVAEQEQVAAREAETHTL